ncbi:MAG: ExbD/TolR family protein [Alphaproteobacteria bacterium]
MRLPRPRRRREDEASILPLINVVFLLLIFFLVAAKLALPDPFGIQPPASASEGAPEARVHEVLVAADGRLAVDGETVDEAGLRAALGAIGKDAAEPLRLKADGGAEATRVIAVMEMMREAGVAKVRLLTAPGER